MRGLTKKDALPAVGVVVVALVAWLGTGTALAAAPWWHIVSGSRPTNLWLPKNEVQEITDTETGSSGGFFLVVEGHGEVGGGELPYNVEAPQVQAALSEAYGAGNVEVAGGPGGTKPFRITTINGLAGKYVPKITAVSFTEPRGISSKVVVEGGSGQLVLKVSNVGDVEVDGAGAPVTIADKLPPGLSATAISGLAGKQQGERAPVECSLPSLTCTFEGTLPPYEQIEISIAVSAATNAKSGEELLPNEVMVTGGEAPRALARQQVTVNDTPSPFGIEDYELSPESEGGSPDTQAGSHPFQLTVTLALNQTGDPRTPPAPAKDLNFDLPPGLIGNPTPFPQCTDLEFNERAPNGLSNGCPSDTAMGVASVTLSLGGVSTAPVPLFNLTPEVGEPARFGFDFEDVPVILDTSIRTGGDYGVTVSVSNISELPAFLSSRVTFWGVPGDPRHDQSRGWECLSGGAGCTPLGLVKSPPLLTLPTSCAGPLHTIVEADSWVQPGSFVAREYIFSTSLNQPFAMDGCDRLGFEPSINVAPDTQEASRPTGLTVNVHVPQEEALFPEGLAPADVRNIAVTLPEGVTLNPSAADGLGSCSESQIGYIPGESHPPSELHFTPKLPGSIGSIELLQPGVNFCPNASKIAEATITTPLLPKGQPVKGFVYLASPQNFDIFPQENPFETHVAMYLVAEDPISGSLVKLPGSVELGGQPGVEGLAPGQIRSTFADNPQLPFEDAELHFFGGERAPLASPNHCGTYTTNATFTSWSGGEPVHSSSNFEVTSGPNGTSCPGAALPFSPSLASGMTNNNAGSFSPLTTTLSRPDGNQSIQSVTLHYPPGVSGLLSGVELCGEAQANAGTCGPNSRIGETIVSVGVGGDPFTVTGGKVYLTGPYDGAPFGLSIITPATAGPFDLQQGRPVVVRAKVEVNPMTAALTVTTNTLQEGYEIPTIIEGFPLQIQHVNVLINRPRFTFNPTSCIPTEITGRIDSAEGTSFPVKVPFQPTNCAALKFEPKFAASTSGKTSKANGASLTVRLTYPNTPQGTEANIARVKVDLPKQLPSRLTTLQKACLAATFDVNPANCPAASVVGHAKAITPILPVPLEGPAYFVSHGGEAFPSLIFVLQGYGVSEDLVGTTFISKAGITSSTFKSVPDVPVGSFELTLPQERYSALAANGNLCKSKLAMPTAFVGQNGAEIHTSTPISVTGCKPALGILRHSVKGTKATIVVSVPSAGKLLATGKGVSAGRGKAGKAGDVSVKVTLTKAEQAFLKKYPSRKLKAKINLRFTPRKGAKLTTSVTVLIA